MKDFLYKLLRPRHWIKRNTFNKDWDQFVLNAIASGQIQRFDEYHAKVDGVLVWVKNYPYAYGTPDFADVMPSARTVDLLFAALLKSDTNRKMK